ncbi:MAG: hypothetical protein ACKOW0_00825 [Schleiferiaceae bacterium]
MQQYIDTITAFSNGVMVPLAGASVTVRRAGTGTLATLYSSNSTSSPRANPLTASATGLVSFYAADGRYDLLVSKAGFDTVTITDVLLEDPADGIITTISGADISGSTVDSTVIGAVSPSTGAFTSLQLTAGATGTIGLGEVRLNTAEATLDVGLGGGVVGQMFEEMYITVKNSTGSAMTSGQVVTFTGVNGVAPTVGLAQADASYQPLYTVGVITQDIAAGAVGRATTFGKVRGANTTGGAENWQVGDVLFISPTTPGALTNVEPTAPNAAISVAAVLSVSSTDGVLLVRPLLHAATNYGVFSSTQSQTAVATSTPYAVAFNTTDASRGVEIVSGNPSRIRCTRAGLYNFQFSAQLAKSTSSVGYVWIWPRVNGTNIANSATKMSVAGSGSEVVPAWNFVLPMAANDYFELMYAVSSTAVSFPAVAAEAFCPAIPSVILTATQVNQ